MNQGIEQIHMVEFAFLVEDTLQDEVLSAPAQGPLERGRPPPARGAGCGGGSVDLRTMYVGTKYYYVLTT